MSAAVSKLLPFLLRYRRRFAAGAVFLASGLASYVTGHTLVIDGGGSTTGIS